MRFPQTIASRYGRPDITVSEECPTGAIRHRLGSVHIATAPEEVTDLIAEAVAAQREAGNAAWTPELEAEAIAFALWVHDENRAEYGFVMGSH